MALAYVQSANGLSGSTPLTAAFGSNVTAGNLLVMTIFGNSGNTGIVSGVTDNFSNTWTPIPGAEAGNGSNVTMGMYYCHVATGGASFTASVAFNDVASNLRATVQEFSGFVGTPTLDKFATAQGSGLSASSGATGTTTQANELVIAAVSRNGTAASVVTAGTGFSNLASDSIQNSNQASMIVSSTGTQTATFSLSSSRSWICEVATFYDAVTPTATGTFFAFM